MLQLQAYEGERLLSNYDAMAVRCGPFGKNLPYLASALVHHDRGLGPDGGAVAAL